MHRPRSARGRGRWFPIERTILTLAQFPVPTVETVHYTPVRIRQTANGPRFRVGRLVRQAGGTRDDISRIIDRTYDYASVRELRWHLADRLGHCPADVRLLRA